MGPHTFFHVEIFFRHFRDDAILPRNRRFERGNAGPIGTRGLRLAAHRPAVLQRGGQMLQRLLLPQMQQTRRQPVLVTQIRHRHLVAQRPAQDGGFLVRGKHAVGPRDGFLRGTHDKLRCSIVWSGGCHISTEAGHLLQRTTADELVALRPHSLKQVVMPQHISDRNLLLDDLEINEHCTLQCGVAFSRHCTALVETVKRCRASS